MKFTKHEINQYNTELSKIFKEYCAEQKLGVHLVTEWPNMHQFYLVPENFQYQSTTFLDSDKYFKDHKFFNDDLKIISPIKINDPRRQFIQPKDFWQYVDDRLDKKGQVLFQRIINENFQAHVFKTLIEQRSDEQNWFYIKHIHDGERKSGTQGEFNIFFDFVKTQELNTQEKVQNFYTLCKHSRNIVKKPEYIPIVCDFINSNIPKEHHENFEILLGKKLKRNFIISDTSDIMKFTASQTMTLEKDKCYEKFNFSKDTTLNINTLNSLNYSIVRALKNNHEHQLGLSNIMIVPFTSETNFSKIAFEFNSADHRTDMPEIYVTLVVQCAPIYTDKTGNYKNIEKNVVATVNHYLLHENLSNTDKKSPRIKI